MSIGGFTRTFEIRRGQHVWMLLGPKGAVQFKASPDLSQEIAAKFYDLYSWIDGVAWTGWDLGYHSPQPTFDGQEPISDSCEFLDGMPCYYDGSSLSAQELLADWASGDCDDEIIWRRLRSAYSDWLEADAEVCASPATALSEAMRRWSV